ncbi:hypothetical protein BWI96_06195 [Siphonobacter sp. SORGH_AS_0500]|nr:hypothetical protein BWI96_06195 [Siphonobacter sp. SORGH_AS_0500]
MIDPAFLGTQNVLNTVNQTPSVKGVVLTSSCAAIYTDAIDCKKGPNGTLNEAIWNTTASLTYQPYSYSKPWPKRKRGKWPINSRNGIWSPSIQVSA